MSKPRVRRLEKYVPLTREELRERFFAPFYDPAFDEVKPELERVFEKVWDGYEKYRKSLRTRPAGPEFADPAFPLPLEWLETRARIRDAERRHRDAGAASRVLIVSSSTRSEHTCPGEISKSVRLAQAARDAIAARPGFEVDLHDLSDLADEPLKVIHPRKACARCTGIRRPRA